MGVVSYVDSGIAMVLDVVIAIGGCGIFIKCTQKRKLKIYINYTNLVQLWLVVSVQYQLLNYQMSLKKTLRSKTFLP